MDGLMQSGPTLYEAKQRRKKKGTRGLLGEIGEPMSYAPGPVGLLGNALLGAQYLTGEKPLDEGLSALAIMTGLMQGTKVAPIMRNAIKVYHGSPHKFDKPDSSKIGTGEGAQAYGHGLYWAENPGVANDYANKLAKRKGNGEVLLNGKQVDVINRNLPETPKQMVLDTVSIANGNLDEAEKLLLQRGWTDEINWFQKNKGKLGWKPLEPNLYEANLRWPDPAREAADPLSAKHFLDWDKPLSEQSKQVQDAINAIPMLRRGVNVDAENTAYDLLNGLTGGKFNNPANSERAAIASKILGNAGIPGITYLDAGSRAAGQGTRNYVTFDDALVELLKRNGGLLGAGK